MEHSREQIKKLKQDIKTLVAQQKSIKPQRKTVHFTGTRILPAWKAAAQHELNRYKLRHLYIAYGIMRGKTIEQIEPKRKTEYSESFVQKITDEYGQVVCSNT